MAGRIAAAKALYREAKYEVWDTLEPATRSKIIGCWQAFEGATISSIAAAIWEFPHPSWKTIGITALTTGYVAVKNYLKDKPRTQLTDQQRAEVRDNAGS